MKSKYDLTCRWCAHKEKMCMETKDSKGHTYICTRPKGHAGLHRACGQGWYQHPIYSWSPYTKAKEKLNGRLTAVPDMVDNRSVQKSSAPGMFSLQGGNPADDSGGNRGIGGSSGDGVSQRLFQG